MAVTQLKRRFSNVLIFTALLLLVLPEIARFPLIKTLPSMGLGEVAIDDVDLNVFEGSAAIDHLTLTRDGEVKLGLERFSVNVSWLQLLVGIINMQELTLEGVRLTALQLRTAAGKW